MGVIIQTAGAFFAVASFSMILEVPKKLVLWSGLAGGLCWLVYLLVKDASASVVLSAFVSGLSVAWFGQTAAKRLKAPATVFLIPGILPLVPGASIYHSVYFMIHNSREQSVYYLMETLQIAGAIAMAVFLMDSLFQMARRRKTRRGEGDKARG